MYIAYSARDGKDPVPTYPVENPETVQLNLNYASRTAQPRWLNAAPVCPTHRQKVCRPTRSHEAPVCPTQYSTALSPRGSHAPVCQSLVQRKSVGWVGGEKRRKLPA